MKHIIAVMILAAFLVLALGSAEEDPEVAAKREKYGSKVGAWVAAQGFIEDRLNSPGSADYGWQTYDDCVTDLGDGEYRVKGWVDAQNGFGALKRINFSLTVEYQGDDNWKLVEEPMMYER